jgi:hypothetical protein
MSTNAINQALLDYLETNLPAEITALGLPSVREFIYGEPTLAPFCDFPMIGVDTERWEQDLATLDLLQDRRYTVGVWGGIDGQTPQETAALVHKLAEALCTTLEASGIIGGIGTYRQVQSCDFSPSIKRGNALSRICYLVVEVQEDHYEIQPVVIYEIYLDGEQVFFDGEPLLWQE